VNQNDYHVYSSDNVKSTLSVNDREVEDVDIKPLAAVGSNPKGLWTFSYDEATQLAFGTSVVLLRYPFVAEITYGRAPEVFLHYSIS
jgi:hypothetical protein